MESMEHSFYTQDGHPHSEKMEEYPIAQDTEEEVQEHARPGDAREVVREEFAGCPDSLVPQDDRYLPLEAKGKLGPLNGSPPRSESRPTELVERQINERINEREEGTEKEEREVKGYREKEQRGEEPTAVD